MELLEDVKRKGHSRPLNGCWKKAFLHELVHPIHISTTTEVDFCFMDAIGINGLEEDGVQACWIGARFAVMTKLMSITFRLQTRNVLTNKKVLFFAPNSGPVERESTVCANKTLRTRCLVGCAIVALNKTPAGATRTRFRRSEVRLVAENVMDETWHDSNKSV